MGRSILLADDSATIRKVVELTFAGTEFHIECVESGREALARLDLLRPDLILADVVMPEPGGYDLCRTVKASSRPVPVLLLSGTFESFDRERAHACGADGHLTKPFESRALLEQVRLLLDRPDAVEAPPADEPGRASDPEIDALARAVVAHLSERVLRDMAREILPEVAERVVRERIRELESEHEDHER